MTKPYNNMAPYTGDPPPMYIGTALPEEDFLPLRYKPLDGAWVPYTETDRLLSEILAELKRLSAVLSEAVADEPAPYAGGIRPYGQTGQNAGGCCEKPTKCKRGRKRP